MEVYDENTRPKEQEAQEDVKEENLLDIFDELSTELGYAFKFWNRPEYTNGQTVQTTTGD